MKRIIKVLVISSVLLGAVIIFTHCATIMGGGTRQNVSISSTPAQAGVVIIRAGGLLSTPVYEGTTPATVNLKRKYEYIVKISLSGYQTIEVPIEGEFNMWVIGNLCCTGLIGLAIDFMNGAAKTLEPNQINVSLVTALLPDKDKAVYAVFSALDDSGQLRVLSVPLIPDVAPVPLISKIAVGL